MIRIRFPDAATERRALGFLAGRFSFKSWANGETIIPSPALADLALMGVAFSVVGLAASEQYVPTGRDPAALACSVRERLDLIEQIWNSLPEQVSPEEIPPWHLAELARRRAEADASPGAGKPWREALARFGDAS